MAKRATYPNEMPDLFGTASATRLSSEKLPSKRKSSADRRHVLPSNLSAALSYLTEEEFQALASAVNDERNRRNAIARFAKPAGRNPEQERNSASPTTQKPRKAQATKIDAPPLTQTRINAVRAAIKAGLKPKTVARQFGISLSILQRALSNKSG
jgi:hypothetical protein